MARHKSRSKARKFTLRMQSADQVKKHPHKRFFTRLAAKPQATLIPSRGYAKHQSHGKMRVKYMLSRISN